VDPWGRNGPIFDTESPAPRRHAIRTIATHGVDLVRVAARPWQSLRHDVIAHRRMADERADIHPQTLSRVIHVLAHRSQDILTVRSTPSDGFDIGEIRASRSSRPRRTGVRASEQLPMITRARIAREVCRQRTQSLGVIVQRVR